MFMDVLFFIVEMFLWASHFLYPNSFFGQTLKLLKCFQNQLQNGKN